MSVHVKITAIILLLGVIGIIGVKYALPLLQDSYQRDTSDAAATKATVTVGMDNWVGYFPLCSPQMVKNMRRQGYLLRCEDDHADYRARFARLAGGDIQFAVGTVDSYVLNGLHHQYPGTIILVIDESKGGDAMVARKRAIDSLEKIKTAPQVKIAFTPSSPSEHLLKSINADFDLGLYQRPAGWQLVADGSTDALGQLQSGKADVAVLWEPDVSRALADGELVKLIGTEDTEKLIVDILLVDRKFSEKDPEIVRTLLRTYFQVLKAYQDQPELLRDDMMHATGLQRAQVDSMLNGVAFTSLYENGLGWFGSDSAPAGAGLVDTIESVVRILSENGNLKSNPLPDRDPYRITNSQYVSELLAEWQGQDAGGAAAAGDNSLNRRFTPLAPPDWQRLKEIGNLKLNPIGFQRGTADLTYEGKLELDHVMDRVRHYPNFRLLVKGHSALRGDPEANRALSQERADAVAQYLQLTYGIDVNRVHSIGHGAAQPLPRLSGESDRAYGYRLPRVEIALVAEIF